MPIFSKRSKNKLKTCDIRLQEIFNEVVKKYDCSILCGHRSKAEQDKAYNEGKSKLRYPQSKHNGTPSKAVDVAPYHKNNPHIQWNNLKSFHVFAGYVYRVAEEMGYKIRWGGNWEMGDIKKQSFEDLPHFEIL